MRMFLTSKNKYLSNNMTIFGKCSIPLRQLDLTFLFFHDNLFTFMIVTTKTT